MDSTRWITVSDSQHDHDHEREALAWLRQRLPDREPYHVSTNFEFTTHNGQVDEVDALAATDNGVRLIEYHTARALESLIENAKAFRKYRSSAPYIAESVLLSDPKLQSGLNPQGRFGVFGRDAHSGQDIAQERSALGGIVDNLVSLGPDGSGRPRRRTPRADVEQLTTGSVEGGDISCEAALPDDLAQGPRRCQRSAASRGPRSAGPGPVRTREGRWVGALLDHAAAEGMR